jgi:glycosyltransferase involved in cell wall biosynthesis
MSINEGPGLRAAMEPRHFAGWGGATDLMRMLLEGMTALPDRFENIYLLTPTERLSRRFKAIFLPPKQRANVFDPAVLADLSTGLERIKFESFHRKRLAHTLKKKKIDFCLIPDATLGASFPHPWICYIHDFQHKHYPSFFSDAEIQKRDRNFAKMLSDAPVLLAGSKSVVDDVRAFFPRYANKISAVPFSPLLRGRWLSYDIRQSQNKYEIEAPYFMISNQLWIHKNHAVAFLSLAKLIESSSRKDITLVCTGSLHDYRQPDHLINLKKMLSELSISGNVRLLGHIPKEDQIALLRGAKAIIQPTLFEGLPAGGSGHEAVALGVPLIASDIKVNLEIEDERNVHFFPPHDADALSRLMETYLTQTLTPSIQELTRKSDLRRERLCVFLWSIGLKTKRQFDKKFA